MPIVRMIYVTVSEQQGLDAERLWKHHCAPLMIQQPGCLSEKLLRCVDKPGEYISYSEWKDWKSIDNYRKSAAHEEILKHTRGLQSARPDVKRYEIG